MLVLLAPGDDWCSAANAAAPGDEIVLQAGEHAGPCTLNSGGAEGLPVVVRAEDPENPPLIVYERASSNVIDVQADYITIRGLAFGPTQADIDAVKIKSGSYVTVEDSVFSFVGGISVSANSADSTGLTIRNNTFTDLNATAIYLGCHDGQSSCTAADVLVEGNLIDDVTSSGVGYGMELKKDSWGVIRDNVVNDTQGPGIEVFGSEDAARATLIDGNFAVRSRNNASIEVGGSNVTVTNNIVVGGAEGGIYVYAYWESVHDVIVAGNTVIGETGPALRVADEITASRLIDNAAYQVDGSEPFPASIAGLSAGGNVECGSLIGCWINGEEWDFRPAVAGRLMDEGVAESALTTDFCAHERGAVPYAGAIETEVTYGAWTLSIAPKSEFGCAALGADDDDPSDEHTGEARDPSSDSALAPSDCGCASTRTPAAFAGLALVTLLTRRRPRANAP